MPKYRFTAVDSNRKPVSGELEAAGADEALKKLTEQGFEPESVCLSEVADLASGRRLTTDEAVELASQVAQMAKVGLPLPEGLEALAQEVSGPHLRHTLRALAKRLRAGATLEEALKSQESRFPAHIRGLLLAGVRSGRLPEVLEEFVDIRQNDLEMRRRISLSLAYPTVLLGLVAALFLLFEIMMIDSFKKIYYDFEVDLPLLTELTLKTMGPGALILAGWAMTLVVAVFLLPRIPGPAGLCRLLYVIPLIGPLWRFSRLAQCLRLIGVLLSQRVPLPEALRLAAAGVPDAYLAAGCRRVADEVESGRRLSASLTDRSQFPASMIPLIQWGEQAPALDDSFRAAAEVFEGRVQTHGVFLETVMVPITFFVIVLVIGLCTTALFMPLIQLITQLSG